MHTCDAELKESQIFILSIPNEGYNGTLIASNYRDDLFATAGATQGLNLLSHMLFSEGDIAFVEDPTYFLAMKMFNDAGMKVIGCKLCSREPILIPSTP